MSKGSSKNDQRASLQLVEDQRNVTEQYKHCSIEHIREDLSLSRHNFEVLVENYASDFNLGTVIRSHNAFLGRQFSFSGRRKWDNRSAVGTHHYEPMAHYNSSTKAIEQAKRDGKRIVVVDDIDRATNLFEYSWDPNSLMVFGQEEIGVSNESLRLADDVVYIPRLTSTRSLNVGSVAAISMYEYLSQQYCTKQPSIRPKFSSKLAKPKCFNPRYPQEIRPEQRKTLIDHFAYWRNKDNHVNDSQRSEFAIFFEDIHYELNLATAARNHNAFGAKELWITGPVREKDYYQAHEASSTLEAFKHFKQQGYKIVAFDFIPKAVSLYNYVWQDKSLMVFGQENQGLSDEALSLADDVVYIPQYGSTRSLNVGISSAIAMYDYRKKQG
jgi:tRNA G18 (ribose-2'-O)-methylase SpoU